MEEKKMTAEEMERQLNAKTEAFISHIRKEEKETLDKLDAEIKELTEISKKDDLGF